MIITKENFGQFLDINKKHNGMKSRKHNIPPEHWAKSMKELFYCYISDINIQPKCSCGNILLFPVGKYGYHDHCSNKCKGSDMSVRNKSKETKLLRYNNENYNNRDQAKKTCLLKYGVDHNFKMTEHITKSKETKLLRYNDENYNNKLQEKETKLLRYNNENYNNRDQAKKTCLLKYGVDNYSKTQEAKNKISIKNSINRRNYYNEKLDKHCFLYLVESKSLDSIKIGITSNIDSRISQLQSDFSNDCKIINYQFIMNASKYENYFHRKYKIDQNVLTRGSGRTEWFNINIKYNLILDFNKYIKGIQNV